LTEKLIVYDSGPLIALGKINQLSLLSQLFEDVFIPEIVRDECLVNLSLPGAQAIKRTIEQEKFYIINTLADPSLEKSLSILDEGERAAIFIAKELDAVLLIDEKRGRIVAHNFALKVKGTAGLLLNGYKRVL